MNDEPSPRRPRPAFTLSEEEELHLHDPEQAALSPGSNASHRPQAVFNLDLGYSSEDDALLDWEQYAGMNRVRCCGLDCSRSPFARCLQPPQWWYTYTKRQRRCMLGTLVGLGLLLTALITLVALAATRGGSGAPGDAGQGSGEAASGEASALCGWASYRLPGHVVPRQYNLTLEVAMAGDYGVEGSVAIEVEVLQATRCVVLHAADMEVLDARLGGPAGLQGRTRQREAEQQLVLEFGEELPRPAATLFLAFRYRLKEGLSGFYRSSYTAADGKTRSLATTQFEAAAARLAFPCFDEPAFKAVFNTEIIAPADMQVLSNMPPRAVHSHAHNEEEHTRTWHFQPTPPMSTYLVCFIVGEFASTSRVVAAGTGGTVNVSVWGTPDRVGDLQYAADTAAAILPAYEKALGVQFPLPKLDLVAIPDFSAGAMENWGVITYRETALLASPASSLLDLRYVAVVVAHEMAHQWFGNLVTMDFWNELWLNEGFASYFEYVGATAAHPNNSYFSTFYSDNQPQALYFDSKRSSHPLSMAPELLNSTSTIESVFDAIMYQKGASVLRMLRAWANRASRTAPLPLHESVPGTPPSKDNFLLGLQRYLEQHAYNTTRATDVWTALTGPLGFDVLTAMAPWTYQPGYPLVTVTVDDRRRVRLQQAPFGLQGATACDPNTAWWIPISYVVSDAPQQLKWTELKGCQSERPLLTLPSNASWVKLNAQQYGFFRVQYAPPGMWQELAAAAGSQGGDALLGGTDLAGLIEDSYSLAEAGAGPIAPFLDLLKVLPMRAADDYEPWAAALPYVFKLERLLPCYTDWQAWVRDGLLRSFLRQPGAPGGARNASVGGGQLLFSFSADGAAVPAAEQSVGYRLLRPAILRAAGLFAVAEVRAAAANLFSSLEPPEGEGQGGQAPVNGLEADIRDAVYQGAARTDSFEVYQQLLDMYGAATEAAEKERTLLALGYAPGGSRVQATLQLALSDDVRAQDVRLLVVNVARNGGHSALQLTWAWLQQHFGALLEKLGGDPEALRRVAQVAEGVASLFADRAKEAEVDAFFGQLQDRQLDPGYAARAKESIAANAAWLDRHGEQACSWVAQQRGTTGG